MNRWLAPGLLLAAVAALALRLPQLDQRPLHADEAVQAVKFLKLWQEGDYRYDRTEFHGPILNYATLPFAWLSSARTPEQLQATVLRAVPVFFGTGMILLLALLYDGLGRKAALWAGAFAALSPAMTFYSRYYIHETLLVFFTLAWLGALWRYWRSRSVWWAVLAGACLGLMHATKETFVLSVGALLLACMASLPMGQSLECNFARLRMRLDPRHVVVGVAAAVAVSVLFYSSFFTNWAGPADSIRTYLPWLSRASGQSVHVHPWHFYLQRLFFFHTSQGPFWSEGLIALLALVGIVGAWTGGGIGCGSVGFVRCVGLYTMVLLLAYTVIPYKTPWCCLGFLSGMIPLAGVGAVTVLAACRPRWMKLAIGFLLAAGCAHLGVQSWRAAFPYSADRCNPHVYAHTSRDICRLIEQIDALARFHPQREGMLIKIVAPGFDFWPLPWYLRKFTRVGYWAELPPDPYAPVMLVGARLEAALDEKSDKKYLMTGLYELRPSTARQNNFLELYVEFELWKRYVESRPPPRDD